MENIIMKIELGDKLQILRKNMNYKQKDFAEFLNIPQPSLSAYENRKNSPPLEVLINIAKKCNISLDYLAGLSTDAEVTSPQTNTDIYKNRANLNKDSNSFQDLTDFECCSEDLAFALKDNYHEFSIGLSTIMHCVAIAEYEGYLPKLPDEWWTKVGNRLNG